MTNLVGLNNYESYNYANNRFTRPKVVFRGENSSFKTLKDEFVKQEDKKNIETSNNSKIKTGLFVGTLVLALFFLTRGKKGAKVEAEMVEQTSKESRVASATVSRGTAKISHNVESIMAPEFKSIKQMRDFNKNVFGVKVFDVQDKEYAKFLTDGMIKFYNKTGGQFGIPKNIIVCDLPNPNGYMMYEQTKDILAISKKHLDKFREIATVNGETLEQVLKKWGQTKCDGTVTSIYEKGLFGGLFHEFGHKAHFSVCKEYGNLDINWSKNEFQDIASKVSKYSKTSPEEFVAETFSLLVQGKSLPQDVMQLYAKCGGPIIK